MFAGGRFILVTNNKDCHERYRNSFDCVYSESWDYGQVLVAARDLLHQGCVLLSHPLAGSLKPNQTPYRSLVLSGRAEGPRDRFTGLLLLEQAIDIYYGFQRNRKTPDWPEKYLKDFRAVDLSLVEPTARQCLANS